MATSPEVAAKRLELRRESVLANSGPAPRALEIGPAHNGILRKRDGFDVKVVDYLDRTGLVDKYKRHQQYQAADIEEVDFVLPPGAAMADVIDDRFDLIVASHVIEHTVSLIDFVNECDRLLRPDGVLALVVPDSRYCFDRFRERASLARVIDAAESPSAVHTVGTVIEAKLNAVKHRGATAWAPDHRGEYELVNQLAQVRAWAQRARGDAYIDMHNWVFTPHHLRLLLHDLDLLGYIAVRESHFRDTVRHEFMVNLSATGPGPGLAREDLLRLAAEESRFPEEIRFTDSRQQ